jgi:hypothetical protein
MAKLKLINTYKKLSNVVDASGMPVVENGLPKRVLRTMYRYGIVSATPEELAMYKKFKNQEGTNYYREEKGVPLYHSREFLGNETTLQGYVREDGKVGFSVDSTEVDTLTAMAEKFPHLSAGIATQIAQLMLSGGRLQLSVGEREEIEEEEL